MPHNWYNPTPLAVDDLPEAGRICPYFDDDWNKMLAVIMNVTGGKHRDSQDRTYYDVGAYRFKPGAHQLVVDPSKMGNPISEERDGWRYYPRFTLPSGEVVCALLYCPCGPGTPQHPCP